MRARDLFPLKEANTEKGRKNGKKKKRMKKQTYAHRNEKTEVNTEKKGTSKHVFPRFYSSMSQLFGTHQKPFIYKFLFRQTGRHTYKYICGKKCILHTPFLVHLVSNQTLDEGLVTIETFVKV